MEPWSRSFVGRLEEQSIESKVLEHNPLGDPATRPIWVQLPPGYDAGTDRYPSIYLLQGLTGQLDMWKNRAPFRKNVPELMDELWASTQTPRCILVYVDCWTRWGGSQFLDSPATGRYHTHLCEEIVPWVDARYRTMAHRDHRAVAGKSSGGYGAMITPMLRPDLFGGLATHAGDALFEVSMLPAWREASRRLRDRYHGSYQEFWDALRTGPALAETADGACMNDWCMAACYSADPDGTVRLPYDPLTGRMIPEIWQRWLEHDPVRMVAKHADALRSLRAIYVDAGRRDEYFLDLGAEAFRQELAKIGVTDVYFELFDGTHRAIEYRYPIAIRYLAERLAARLARPNDST